MSRCQREYTLSEGNRLRCVLNADHIGYHVDEDGLPFGPWIERTPPTETGGAS